MFFISPPKLMLTLITPCHSAELRQISNKLSSLTYHSACICEHQLQARLYPCYWVCQTLVSPRHLTIRLSWCRNIRHQARVNMYTHMCMLVYMNKHVSHQISNNMYIMLGFYSKCNEKTLKHFKQRRDILFDSRF